MNRFRKQLALVAALLASPLALSQPNPGALQSTDTRPAPTATSIVMPLPNRLSQTGLYRAGSTSEIAPDHLPYTPQYPLWSDAASKRRWIWLPPGTQIDASDPDHWQFPIGTRFWKEFSFGERTETRYLERLPDGSYRYASYVWDDALADALLAPSDGVLGARDIGEGVSHDIPSDADCRACHEGRRSPVLGFNALQLSPERDPLAPHREQPAAGALDLYELVRRGLLRNLPAALQQRAPRIDAPSATARAAAGYLFGNCASCHNAEGPLSELGLDFDQSVLGRDGYARLCASLDRSSRFRLPGVADSRRAVARHPEQSALWFRMQSRNVAARMPPLGSKRVDRDGTRLIERWLASDFEVPPARPFTSNQPNKEHEP